MQERFGIKRGINLSHWISQVFGWSPRATFITAKDIEFIKNSGFDHVRIPFDEDQLWSESGKPIEEAWTYFTNCIDWALANNLKVVADFHILRSHHFNAQNNEGAMTLWDEPAAQQQFLDLWTYVSSRLHHYPVDMLAYELMNEPVAPEHEQWNELAARCHAHVRALESERWIILGSNRWQFASTYPYFRVPSGDSRIILSFHTYEPMLVTHHTAEWLPIQNYRGPVHYPGWSVTEEDIQNLVKDETLKDALRAYNLYFDKTEMQKNIQFAIDKANETGLQLYCGEFGCLPRVSDEIRFRYYRDIVSLFETNDIAYTHWDYKGDFGIVRYDRKTYQAGEADTQLISILSGKQ